MPPTRCAAAAARRARAPVFSFRRTSATATASAAATAAASAAAPPRRRPFPLPLHVGTDVCHIPRVYALLVKPARSASKAARRASQLAAPAPPTTPAARFLRRLLTPQEARAVEDEAGLGTAAEPEPLRSPPLRPPPPPPPTATAAQVVAWLARGGRPAEAGPGAAHPQPALWTAARHLAGRFAAKEAAIKAHPHLRGLTLQSVRIVRAEGGRNGSGPPLALVTVPAGSRHPAEQQAVEQEARLSISHDGDYATAVCLGFEEGEGDSTIRQTKRPLS